MTFKTERARIAANPAGPFMNVDHFSELVTYRPAGGGSSRQVRAHLMKTALEIKEADVEGTISIIDVDEIWLKVPRDRATEQANGYDAIDEPREGDSMLRDGERPDEPWSFQDQIRNETPHSWYLLFARNRPTTYR